MSNTRIPRRVPNVGRDGTRCDLPTPAGGNELDETAAALRRIVAEQADLISRPGRDVGRVSQKDNRDVSTETDERVESAIRNALTARFPGHGVRGEELGGIRADAEYQWLIDPIDGTKYYAGGSTLYSISVALLHRAEPILGVVHNVAAGQCFSAWKGGGAHLDTLGQLHGPEPRDLGSLIANVDTAKSDVLPPDEQEWFESRLVGLTRSIYRIRALGVGALAAAWVATGALDAYVDLTGYSKPEDLAAGRVLMAEAGARVEYVEVSVGPPRLVAARPDIWDELARVLL